MHITRELILLHIIVGPVKLEFLMFKSFVSMLHAVITSSIVLQSNHRGVDQGRQPGLYDHQMRGRQPFLLLTPGEVKKNVICHSPVLSLLCPEPWVKLPRQARG